jgi:hypothetical protein
MWNQMVSTITYPSTVDVDPLLEHDTDRIEHA